MSESIENNRKEAYHNSINEEILKEQIAKMDVYVTALESLGARDYNLADVFAELNDNALTYTINANEIIITLNPDILSVLDNGSGQDFDGVTNALKLGKLTLDILSQNVFGVGLKQIWMWAGDSITIASKKAGELAVHTVTMSYQDIKSKYQLLHDVPIPTTDVTSFKINEVEFCVPEKHFWYVAITKLKNKKLEITKQTLERLALIEASYIRKGVRILVNGQPLKKVPEGKLVLKKSILNPSFNMSGYWAILEKGGKFGGSKYYGAETYHNGRMITHADKDILGIGDGTGCQIAEHPSFYRLKCVIFFQPPSILDHNKVSNKNNWVKDDNYFEVQSWLYENVTKQYKIELAKIQESEEKVKQQLENEALAKTANPFLKDAFPEMKQPRKKYVRTKTEGENTEDLECPVRTQSPSEEENNTLTGEYTGEQTPKQPHTETRPHIPIYIGDIPYDLLIIPSKSYPSNDHRYHYFKDDINHTITLETNENSKYLEGLDSSQRLPILIEWVFEVIVRLLFPNYSETDFIEERERRLASVNIQKWYSNIEGYMNEAKRTKKVNTSLDTGKTMLVSEGAKQNYKPSEEHIKELENKAEEIGKP